MTVEEPKTVKVNSVERFAQNYIKLDGLLQNLNNSHLRVYAGYQANDELH